MTGEQIRKGGGGSADQVQTKKAAVTPVYSRTLCLDGVAATARLSLDDLGDRVPPLGTWVLHTDDCAGGKDSEGAGVFVVLGFGLGHERRHCLVQSVALLSPLLLQGGRVSEQLGAKRPAIQELGRTEAMRPRRVPEFQ